MKYKVIGEELQPLMIFITGAGIGPHMWNQQVEYFKGYKKIVFNLPGHGDNSDQPFTTIQDVGLKILMMIHKESANGKAIVIGHSIGAQILMWLLEHYREYIEKAVIISGLNKAMKGISWLIKPAIRLSMPLIKFRSFARLQSKELCLPEDMFEDYYHDSLLLSSTSLTNTIKENMSFNFNQVKSYPDSMVIVGQHEKKLMKTSAKKTAGILGNSGYYNYLHAAHGIPYEVADELNELIDMFLKNQLTSVHIKGVKKYQL